MGAVLRRLLGGFVTVSWYAVATPVLLGELFFWLIGGFFVFVLVTILALRILTEVIEGASAYWPELLVTVQILVMGFPVTAYVWAERSSLKAYKTHICPEVEARVQDGLARPQTPFENYFVWVRPNIRKSFDANGAVIPVLQQNDGIAMTISARAKAWAPVVPNLLDGDRAMQVMDPMSENARVAAACHMEFGPVHVLDPFGVTGFGNARYNPLDRLDPDSPDLGEDAATLAEALVMDPPGQVQEAHWSEEARALVAGLILFCVAHEGAERRTLATVREYLSLPAEWLRALLELMQDSREAHALIARAANGFLGKADREAASVLSNAQRHTHFLDSSRIADALSQSDFHFADLRYEAATVFLALPPNRMDAYPC